MKFCPTLLMISNNKITKLIELLLCTNPSKKHMRWVICKQCLHMVYKHKNELKIVITLPSIHWEGSKMRQKYKRKTSHLNTENDSILALNLLADVSPKTAIS